MRNLMAIIGFTVFDQVRQKSFIVLLGMGILLLLLTRSCYGGAMMVNGREMDSVTVAWHASKIAFHLIVTVMYLFAALLAMGLFSRDRDDGSLVLFLSRPVRRWQYTLGRVVGVWILAGAFMFMLHLAVFCIMWSSTGGTIPGFLIASVICCGNLLFVIVLITLFTLFMPDIIAAVAGIAVIIVGFVSDGGHQLMNSDLVRSTLPGAVSQDVALWRLIYPKLFMVQNWAGSLFSNNEFVGFGPVHPLLNVVAFSAVVVVVLLVVSNRRDV